jgi:predicted exporter
VLGSHIEAILSAQIHREADSVHLAVWLGPHDPAAVAAALADLDGVRYFSQRDRINALARTYQHRAAVALGLGLVVILLVLAWRYRSLSQAFQMLVPSLVGMVLVLAGFTALNQPISFFHLLATALVVAICVDYGIFYTERRAGELLATYRAMGASMLTTIAAFAALGLAENLLLKTLAVTVVVGVAAGFLLCPLLIAVPGRVEVSR